MCSFVTCVSGFVTLELRSLYGYAWGIFSHPLSVLCVLGRLLFLGNSDHNVRFVFKTISGWPHLQMPNTTPLSQRIRGHLPVSVYSFVA